jgi:hypothetical protein
MADHDDREAFIPYRRADLIEMCLEDGRLNQADRLKFREFCEILSAYYHFDLHRNLETLKANFAPFNPDRDTIARREPSPQELQTMQTRLVDAFETVLKRANYQPVTQQDLERAFEEESLVPLNTRVDFDDFELMVCHYRGSVTRQVTFKQLYFWEKKQEVPVYERVAMLLKFKPESHFVQKGEKVDALGFEPGKMYVYFYKDIPRYDLELLFPNVKVSMTLKDQLMFGIPAIGATVAAMFRTLPNILLILGAILFFTAGADAVRQIGVNEGQVRNVMPILTATLALVVALGGVAVKQWTSYQSKQIKFQKSVTDTLFFRNLDSNAGVFNALIDSAEEEETKEIILVYYHLLTQPEPLNKAALDNYIEAWMEETFGTKIDFDIEGPLQNLAQINGKLDENGPPAPLLLRRDDGRLVLLSLDQSKRLIDYVWDNLFRYNGEPA